MNKVVLMLIALLAATPTLAAQKRHEHGAKLPIFNFYKNDAGLPTTAERQEAVVIAKRLAIFCANKMARQLGTAPNLLAQNLASGKAKPDLVFGWQDCLAGALQNAQGRGIIPVNFTVVLTSVRPK